MSTDRDHIRTLNDELRKRLLGGGAVITPGIAALGAEAVERLVKTIAIFDDFCTANGPYDEAALNSTASRLRLKSTILINP